MALNATLTLSAAALSICASGCFAEDRFVQEFAGGYAGAHLAFATFSTDNSDVNGQIFTGSGAPTQSALTYSGGVMGGYNWLFRDDLILGLEAEYASAMSIEEFYSTDASNITGDKLKNEVSGMFSVNARVGIAQERAMFYISGGVSSATYDMQAYAVDTSMGQVSCAPNTTCAKSSDRVYGMNIGIGAEYAVWENFLVRFEFKQFQFQSVQAPVETGGASACGGTPTGECTFGFAPSATQIRVGLVYSF